uniref:p7 protein n=1 Tax=Blueberry virus A TaxID=1206566 RepID=T1YXC4_9CLOS|nr:P7 protein [Blueberry virus A]
MYSSVYAFEDFLLFLAAAVILALFTLVVSIFIMHLKNFVLKSQPQQSNTRTGYERAP